MVQLEEIYERGRLDKSFIVPRILLKKLPHMIRFILSLIKTIFLGLIIL